MTEKQQIDKFKEAARELECDDDDQRFKQRVAKLVRDGAKKNTDAKKGGEV